MDASPYHCGDELGAWDKQDKVKEQKRCRKVKILTCANKVLASLLVPAFPVGTKRPQKGGLCFQKT